MSGASSGQDADSPLIQVGEHVIESDSADELDKSSNRKSANSSTTEPFQQLATPPRTMYDRNVGFQEPLELLPPRRSTGLDSRRSSVGNSLIPPLRKFKERTPKERFRAVALVIMIFLKLIKTTFRKPNNICHVCKDLQLSRDKFIIEDNSFDRNQQAYRSHHSFHTKTKSNFPLGSSSGRISLGRYSDIRARSIAPTKCPFCYLVVCSLKPYPGLQDTEDENIPGLQDLQCEVSWTVDGREILKGPDGNRTRNRTRRIRLHWNTADIPDAYLVLVAPETRYRFGPSQQAWDFDSLFLGRYIKTAAKNTALIRNWLNLCDESHSEECRSKSDERFEHMTAQSYFGVVDVHEMRLTPLPKNAKYVALSYVWGKGKRYKTLLKNVEAHSQPSGLEKVANQFPRVIADSLALVRALGERYLWVDSLCIVQDSPEAWKLNSVNMDMVYGYVRSDFVVKGWRTKWRQQCILYHLRGRWRQLLEMRSTRCTEL